MSFVAGTTITGKDEEPLPTSTSMQVVCMDEGLRGGAGRAWAAQRVKLLHVFWWNKKRCLYAFFANIHAVSR
jgi:hypothetical protein